MLFVSSDSGTTRAESAMMRNSQSGLKQFGFVGIVKVRVVEAPAASPGVAAVAMPNAPKSTAVVEGPAAAAPWFRMVTES